MRNKTRTVNLFSPQLPSPSLPLRWFYTFHPFFLLCSVGESSCVQVSRGRLLSHMLNLVTLPTGLYYARGLILIFRMAAMATRPSSTLISQLFPTRLSTRTASFLENTVRPIHPEISMNLYRVIATEIEIERERERERNKLDLRFFYIYRLVFVNTRYFCAGDKRSYNFLVVFG